MRYDHRCVSTRIRLRAFTLVELVMVVTILGIVAAIAVPRVSGAASSAKGNALEATLVNVRKAIDRYCAGHGQYPGYTPGTVIRDHAEFINQLLLYSDAKGQTNATGGTAYPYGPYLRAPFPKNPFNKLTAVYVKSNPAAADPPGQTYGWVAVLDNGDFGIDATDGELDGIGIVKPSRKLDFRVK